MSARRFKTSDKTTVYIIAIVVIIVAFLLLGGGSWARGMMHGGGSWNGGMFHGGHSLNMASWNWVTILISLGIGVLIGVFLIRRK
jgi:uncharacterized protein YneF (UPF0154 family)